MSELGAHLVDRVLPHVPIRQWLLTVIGLAAQPPPGPVLAVLTR